MAGLKVVALWVLALAMMGIGTLHFVRPKPFVRIVPKYLPAPLTLVYVSGFFEILGGVGLLIPATRAWAAWGLIALYVAVFPANLYVAMENVGRLTVSEWEELLVHCEAFGAKIAASAR